MGCWAHNLRELELLGDFLGGQGGLNFLGGLQQLTFLSLTLAVQTATAMRCVSGLVRLRTLAWRVRVVEEDDDELLELPCLFGCSTCRGTTPSQEGTCHSHCCSCLLWAAWRRSY